METAASFEARFAPSSYPTGPLGQSSNAARTAVLKRTMFPRHRTGNSTVEAESTKNGCKPITAEFAVGGKARFEMLALKPERGKPAFRNFREGDGNGGIIRSPIRAIALPDRATPTLSHARPVVRLGVKR